MSLTVEEMQLLITADDQASDKITGLADSTDQASDSMGELGESSETSLNTLLAATAAIGALTVGLEYTARGLEKNNASFEKMGSATFPEDKMRSMVAGIQSATFPVDDALLYIRTLRQAGVTSIDTQKAGAESFNKIQSAYGVSSQRVVMFSNSLMAMGMGLEDIPASYNAIAYAQSNIIGGFDTYVSWMQKYDSKFKDLGLNIDQTAVIISAATKKFGGGRAAYSGLNKAMTESNGNLSEMERILEMQPGSLSNATEATGKYAGKLERSASITAKHKTIVEKLQAEISKLTTLYGGYFEIMASVGGAIGTGITTIMSLITTHALLKTASGISTINLNLEKAAYDSQTASIRTNTAAKLENTVLGPGGIDPVNFSKSGKSSGAIKSATGYIPGTVLAGGGATKGKDIVDNINIGNSLKKTEDMVGQTTKKSAGMFGKLKTKIGGVGSALSSASIAGMSLMTLLPILIAIGAAIAVVYFWQNDVNKKLEAAEKIVKKNEKALDKLKDKELSLSTQLEQTSPGTKKYQEVQNELKKTQDEIDKTVKKVHESNKKIYAERTWSLAYQPGLTRDYYGSHVVRGAQNKDGFNWDTILRGTDTANMDMNKSAAKWGNPANEQMMASAYNLVLPKYKDLDTQFKKGSISASVYKERTKELDQELGKIVGPENVASTRKLYHNEQRLQQSRAKLSNSIWKLILSLANLVLSIFGMGNSSKKAGGKAKKGSKDMSTLADDINDTADKAAITADKINQLVDKINGWIIKLEEMSIAIQTFWDNITNVTAPDSTGKDGSDGTKPVIKKDDKGNVQITTKTLGTVNKGNIGQKYKEFENKNTLKGSMTSPLKIKRMDPTRDLGSGSQEIVFPELDPVKFKEQALQTGRKMNSGGDTYVINVKASTKNDASVIGNEVKKVIKGISKKR